MKPMNFKQSVLTAGVITALGLSGTAIAADSGAASATGGSQVANIATASYAVDGVTQPTVTSNEVVVNISEVGSFSLVATDGASSTDDINEEQYITPGGDVTFTNTLTNTGNVNDTYTIVLNDTSAGLITDATDDFTYANELTTPIALTVTDANGNPVTTDPDGNPYPATIISGQTIKLAPGNSVDLSYTVTPEGDNDAGDSGLLTLSATSTYITNNATTGADATLENESQGIITNPIFKIVKSASTTNVDLNTATTIDYKIVVTNEDIAYGANATNITIQDAIPAGLALNTATIVVTAADGTTSVANSTVNTLEVTGLDLAKGETATVTFTVNITDKTALATAGSVTNHASVYDSYDDSVDPTDSPDIVDSTDETTDGNTNGVDDPTDDTNDTPAVVDFTDRNLTMTSDNTVELAPNGSTPIAHTITNNGNQAEGDAPGELVLTITETKPDGVVQPTGVITVTIYDTDGTTVLGTRDFPDGTTSIDFNDVSSGGIPAGGTATVKYTESSTNNYNEGTQEPITQTDTNTLTLTPSGGAAPSPVTNTDTFNIKDLELLKEQAIDVACDGTADVAFSVNPITNAIPGQCVVYRITATNSFTTKSLTNVVISDNVANWSDKATYVANSATQSDNGTPNITTTAVASSPMTIAANGTQNLTFSIKINANQ